MRQILLPRHADKQQNATPFCPLRRTVAPFHASCSDERNGESETLTASFSFVSASLKVTAGFHITFLSNFISSSQPDPKHAAEEGHSTAENMSEMKSTYFLCQIIVAAGNPHGFSFFLQGL